jgi:hypothetical protein
VTDQAHVQTKSSQSLAESRDITVIQLNNPTSDPVISYRTAIDPALVSSKPIPVDLRAVDLNSESVPLWYSKYGTGLSSAEIYHKTSVLPGGSRQVMVGDAPFVHDIGATIGLPDIILNNLDDDWHKNVVTDLAVCDVVIGASLSYPVIPYLTNSVYRAQNILFPVSSRHIVKTSDGVLHAVAAYTISGLSRIVHLVSTNGGEQWSAQIVDNDDGHHYVMPSITCDRNDGIHITYTRYASADFDSFWLYAGGSVPDGFDIVSSSGGIAYHRLLGGGAGNYYPTLSDDPDTYYEHVHGCTTSGGTVVGCHDYNACASEVNASRCSWHHTSGVVEPDGVNNIPPSKSLKLLRYRGIPYYLPADIVVPFVDSVPSGYTRYSAQDGYFVYCSDDVGTIVGDVHHRHPVNYELTGSQSCVKLMEGPGNPAECGHNHIGTAYTDYADNSIPSYQVIFGIVDSPLYSIAVDSLIMTGVVPVLSNLTSLSQVGESLNWKYFNGGVTYADLGGSFEHSHPDLAFNTVGASSVVYASTLSTPGCMISMAAGHTHQLSSTFVAANGYVSSILPNIYRVDQSISDLSIFGDDLFYRYISPANIMSSPVNISLIRQYYPSFEGVCLADGSDNVHFLWTAQGLNTSPGKARICYKKITSGVLGSREDITTSDEHMLYPSMDIDGNGDIHTAWFNADTYQAVQYCKKTSGSWGSIEDVDTSSYVGFPSNIITDKDCNVFLLYAKWTDAGTAIKEVMYRKRVASTSTWSDVTNLSPDKASGGYNQFPGQIYLDNKNNVVFTWSGKGYGAHTSVYHPVYRYRKSDGMIVPAVSSDAVDAFPDDDNEILYPTVFWHAFPFIDSVYHNLVVSGLTFMYLYNVTGASKETADLKFYSSPDALVGDVGQVGQGGGGSGEFNPGVISAESLLKKESFSISQRGHICRSYHARNWGKYL